MMDLENTEEIFETPEAENTPSEFIAPVVKAGYRAGFLAMLGVPNAGKSTLANILVGEKFSIISAKAQTTRKRSLGIISAEEGQIVLVDAPGVVSDEKGLNAFIKKEVEDVLQNVDGILVVLNLDAPTATESDLILEQAAKTGLPWSVVITKADAAPAHRIGLLREKIVARYGEDIEVVTVSSLTAPQAAHDVLLPTLWKLMPESNGPLYEDAETYTTQTVRDMASEWIREKCFNHLHQEIPYGLAVQIRKFEENDGPIVKIYADLIVEKENHRKIIIGTGGKTIKTIGMDARADLEKLLDRKIYLELHVAVKPSWVKEKQLMKELGYVVDNK